MNELKGQHFAEIMNNNKYYFVGIDIYHDKLMTPYNFIDQIVSGYHGIKINQVYIMTENQRNKYVLDYNRIKKVIAGNRLINYGNLGEDQYLLCAQFNCDPSIQPVSKDKNFDFDLMHPYSKGYTHRRIFDNLSELFEYVKTIPSELVKEMHLIPMKSTCTLMDDIFGKEFIYYLNSQKNSY